MVVHGKDIEKQNVKNKKIYSFYERPFLQKTNIKIASIGSHTIDMKKRSLKI